MGECNEALEKMMTCPYKSDNHCTTANNPGGCTWSGDYADCAFFKYAKAFGKEATVARKLKEGNRMLWKPRVKEYTLEDFTDLFEGT